MPSGTGLDKFGKRFPDRCFDVGIAEQHAVTFAAGLATEGMKPFCAIYSTFLQRAYDQVVHDVAIQSLPVRFAMDRAGPVGNDGATHSGSFDLAYLGCLPGFVLMAPADEAELVHAVTTAVGIGDRPCGFRYPRGEGVGVALPARGEAMPIGKGRILREGNNIAILSLGPRLADALKAADELAARGLPTTVADARFAKPIDTALVEQLARHHEVLITIEEGSIGGFSAQVVQHLAWKGLLDRGLKLRPMVLPDIFIDHDSQAKQLAVAKLSASDIVADGVGGDRHQRGAAGPPGDHRAVARTSAAQASAAQASAAQASAARASAARAAVRTGIAAQSAVRTGSAAQSAVRTGIGTVRRREWRWKRLGISRLRIAWRIDGVMTIVA